jgi:hypothetical protein
MIRALHACSLSMVLASVALGCAGDKVAERKPPQKPVSTKPAKQQTDAGASGFGNTDTQTKEPPKVQPGLGNHVCARAEVYVERIRPRVVFLVDASSSMSEDLGGITRWTALRQALLAKAGLIPTLQDLVKFGLITYEGPRYTTCPSFRYAAPAPSNLDLITHAFPDAPPEESSTPTGLAMDWAIDNAFLDQVPDPDVMLEAQFMIFATDGEPNGCVQGSATPPLDYDSVIAAVHKAASRGIKVFVISLAEPTGEFADHLKQVAMIGGTDKVYAPQNKGDLVSELETIIGATISCEVELSAGKIVEGRECMGKVQLNGKDLECNGKDGFELVDPMHLLLKGQACDDYKLVPSAMLTATFPCEALL